jgi:hypothetical protein
MTAPAPKKTTRQQAQPVIQLAPEPQAPAAPPKPRQVTRGKIITCAVLVTLVLAAWAHSHHVARTLEGAAVWFVAWDVILTGLLLWIFTGFRHRDYRTRTGRHYRRVKNQGSIWMQELRGGQDDGQGEPEIVDDGRYEFPEGRFPERHWPDWAKDTGLPPAAPPRRRAASPPRGAGGAGKAPAPWRQAAAMLSDVDSEQGPEVLGRILGAGAGLKLTADALGELHTHLTVDRGYDERAMPTLTTAQSDLEDVAGQLNNIVKEISEFYGHLFDAADEGKRAPHDGHEMEE